VTPLSIITTGANEKKGISSGQLLPDWAVLDGELTMSVPPQVTAATGIDAMVHAIEAYTSKLKKNPLSDLLAKESLRLLGKNIRTVCSEEGAKDAKARGDMLVSINIQI
jgi:alcohol dehydrogenase class IV